jgi:hypothetical protein
MAKPQTMRDWLETLGYLPRWFRDHHAQKEVFKWIWQRVLKARERTTAKGEIDYLADMNWVSAHIFVIDNFLWFMALHGYTLQPARRDFEFRDWTDSIKAMKEEEAAAFRKMLEERAAQTAKAQQEAKPQT